MKWFRNQRIGAKLALGFGLCLLSAGGVGLTALRGFATVNRTIDVVANDSLPGQDGVGDMQWHSRQFRTLQFRLAGQRDGRGVAAIQKRVANELASMAKALDDYGKTIHDPEDRENFDAFNKSWAGYVAIHEQIKDAISNPARSGRFDLVESRTTSYFLAEIEPMLDKISEWNTRSGKKAAATAEAAVASARISVFAFLFCAIVIGAVASLVVARGILTPTRALSARLESLEGRCVTGLLGGIQAMEQGDLTVTVVPVTTPVENPSNDELGKMCQVFNSMLAKMKTTIEAYEKTRLSLCDIVSCVQQSAESVAGASAELTAAAQQTGQAANDIASTIQEVAQAAGQSALTSQEMAKGSEQQARTATEAAASMERLTGSIAQVQQSGEEAKRAAEQADDGMKQAAKAVEEVARSSQQMASAALEASTVARSGGKAVDQTVESMQRIQSQVASSTEKVRELDQKSQEIGAIVETIDQIAEQTNLLALNAAIEAARAGEHGKGFAVVADEVRKLAERAAGATKEIGGLISSVRQDVYEVVKAMQESNGEVTDGAAKSREAGEALVQILAAAARVAEEVEGVSAIAEEMSASVEEVLATVETVRHVAEEQEKAVADMAAGSSQVSSAITTVASISQETAAGAEEMSASAEEVSASAQNVSAAVEEQTASVEQVSAAADQLNHMASELKELVARFKVEDAGTLPGPALRIVNSSIRKAA